MYTTENEKTLAYSCRVKPPRGLPRISPLQPVIMDGFFLHLFVDVFVRGDMNLAKPVGDFCLTPETPGTDLAPNFYLPSIIFSAALSC